MASVGFASALRDRRDHPSYSRVPSPLRRKPASETRVFVFLETDDFWRDYERLTGKGVSFVRPPCKEPFGTVAVFEDLYGNRFDLIETRTH
jgi:hypothetical protein